MFNWFRRKKDNEALRSLLLITEFTTGMDRFYASRGSDKSRFPLDTQIIMYSENAAYYAFQHATGKQDLARDGSIYEQVATNLLANQAAIMLFNLAYPKGHEPEDASERLGAVLI